MRKNISRQAHSMFDSNVERAEVQLDIDTLNKAEREIRGSHDYAEAILRTAREPLLVLRADLTVESANESFYNFFKVAPDVTEGRSIYELFNHQWDIPQLRRLLEEIIPRDGFFNDFKITSELPNFGKRVLILNGRRLDIPEDSQQRILLSIEDATERQRLEETIRRDEERFRVLAMASAQVIWTTTPEGQAEEESPSWSAFTGQPFAQCKGQGWLDAIHPDDREAVREILLGCIPCARVYESEYRLRRADGVYRWVAVRAAPVHNPDGSVREWIGASTDITERKEAEMAMARLATIVESSDDAIIAADLDNVITSWNQGAERLYGYTAEEALGQHVTILFPPERFGEEVSALERLRRGERVEDLEAVNRRKDGSEVTVSLTISPIRNAQGKIIGTSGINRDITERKRAEKAIRAAYEKESAARAEAERANRSKDEFLAMVSHELRSPLNAILGYTRALRSGLTDRESINKSAAVIERNAKSQLQIIEDLLDSARIVAGKLRVEPVQIDLTHVLQAALDTVRPAAEAKGVALTSHFGPGSEVALGDPARLQQVVWNLLTNAVKFTPEGGRVELRMEGAADRIRITVSDTGKGIEPEFLPFVFERFRQADPSSTRRIGGLGLGLSLAKHLVELHDGTITATSEGAGRGSTFTVTLPRSRPTSRGNEAQKL